MIEHCWNIINDDQAARWLSATAVTYLPIAVALPPSSAARSDKAVKVSMVGCSTKD